MFCINLKDVEGVLYFFTSIWGKDWALPQSLLRHSWRTRCWTTDTSKLFRTEWEASIVVSTLNCIDPHSSCQRTMIRCQQTLSLFLVTRRGATPAEVTRAGSRSTRGGNFILFIGFPPRWLAARRRLGKKRRKRRWHEGGKDWVFLNLHVNLR